MLPSDSTGESVAVAGGTVVVVTVAVLGASTTNDTGPILAFVGAVLVALIAAYTAGRRQARALEAESDRQARALEAESARLAQQLEHNRELADLEAVRSALDDAALALQRAEWRPIMPVGRDEFNERFRTTVGDLQAIRARLIVRFGEHHAMVQDFTVFIRTFRALAHKAMDLVFHEEHGRRGEARGDLEDHVDEMMHTYEEAARSFLLRAAQLAGARLPEALRRVV